MAFILHIYIIFGSNLLTGGPARIAVFFAYFSISKKRNIKQSPNEMKTFGSVIFGTNVIRRTWSASQEANEAARRQQGTPTLIGRAPASWAPKAATDILPPPIYTYVPLKHPGSQRKTISTTVTFCIREIPSWSLHRCSIGGGESTMEGLYINILAPPMSCEQFTTDLRVHNYQLDGFFSLFVSQYNVLPPLLWRSIRCKLFLQCVCRDPMNCGFMINFCRYHTPIIYLPQNSHHTYLLWHFYSHSEIYCHATFHLSVHMTRITFVVLLFA